MKHYFDITDEDTLAALIASTFLGGETETEYGEQQLWFELPSGESVELTHEDFPDGACWSMTHHSSSDDFDLHGVDIIDREVYASAADIVDVIRDLAHRLACYAMVHRDMGQPTHMKPDELDAVFLWERFGDAFEYDDLLFAYEIYLNAAIDAQTFDAGWMPSPLRHFAREEYLNVWVCADPNAREHAFDYLANLND